MSQPRLVPFVFKPTGRTHLNCTGCACNVASTHVPGSEDCQSARVERLISRGQ